MSITINPGTITTALGTFSVSLDGYIQGFAEDDPSTRVWLTGGQLDPAETLPMWGGVPIQELLYNPTNINSSLKATVKRATSAATTTGFSVFNQDHAMINTPQSPVPLASNYMLVNLYRLNTNARIICACDPALAATLAAAAIMPTAFNWDATNGWITLGTGGSGGWALPTTLKVVGFNTGNSMTVSYASGTGFATWNRAGSAIVLQI
jgi:hypothetical protein